MPARPWFPFYPGDFYQDTMCLTLEEQGAYIKLLSYAWNNDGLVPLDSKKRCQILGVHHHKAHLLWGVIEEYFEKLPEGYRNPRLYKELSKVLDISEKRRKAVSSRYSTNAPTIVGTNVDTTTTTVRKKKNIDRSNGHDPGFDRFWNVYPRKVARPAARKAWSKLTLADREQATQGVRSFTFPEEEKFIPHPATWLNNQRWLDNNQKTTKDEYL